MEIDSTVQEIKSQLALIESNIRDLTMIERQTAKDKEALRVNEEKRAMLSTQLLSLEASRHVFRFRCLRADEVECRISMIRENGLSLLLYKDARVDQNILDETFGLFGWKRSHQLIGDRLYCTVSVWDQSKEQWIEKQDVGTESKTEAEKGQASDSFKRACFNLGIGRELYTAPFIWIPAGLCEIKDGRCYDRFRVTQIGYTEGKITELSIVNEKTRQTVYNLKKPTEAATPKEPAEAAAPKTITKGMIAALEKLCKAHNIPEERICKLYEKKTFAEMTLADWESWKAQGEKILKGWEAAANEEPGKS